MDLCDCFANYLIVARYSAAMRVLNLISFFFMIVPPNVNKVGPGFCPECVRKAGSGITADQTNAMLAVVRADDASLASPQAGRLVHSVARPLPTEPAVAGLRREPCSAVGCLLGLAVKAAHSASCGLTRVDRVNPRRVDTFGTVQLNDALSVASAENSSNAGLP